MTGTRARDSGDPSDQPRPRVAVIHDYHDRAADLAPWDLVRERADVVFSSQRFRTDDEVVAAVGDAEIICAMRERTAFHADLLERLPRLKLLVATGEANRRIDFAAASRLGIEVAGTPNGEHGRAATAELTWALLLAAARHLVREDHAARRGQWQTSVSRTLEGKTIGVVGLGGIGRIIVRYAHAFGMNVLAWTPNMTPERAREAGVEATSLQELLERSDVVTLHLVHSAATANIIDASALASMKPTAVLVNTSRGGLVDEEALVEALRAGVIAGAGLDVFAREPLAPDDAILNVDNVVISPHIAGFTEETLGDWYRGSVDAVLAYLSGEAIPVRHRNRP
jgi:phosphoglycerate dehydrogenase-like enzyme